MIQPLPETSELGFILQGLRHFMDKMELEFARYAAEFAAGQEWNDEGFNTPADWIRINCHMNSNQAWAALAVGEHMGKLSESVQAMRDWEIGYAHLATIGRTAAEVGKKFDETQLLPLAKKFSPGKFFHKVVHYRHALNARSYNEDQERRAEERSLHVGTYEDGWVLVSGILDPVGGAAVRNALEPLARLSGAHDDRTREQRLADALVEQCTGQARVNLQVTATIETLKGLAGAAAGEMEFAFPLSSATVQRLACDCSVTRVLLDQDSLVIDVGRATRKLSPALRKALALRDKHCRWPGCERPASWCDGHHLAHWTDGGETDLDNLVLLCGRHHRMVHEGSWQLLKANGEITVIAPTVTFGLPRGPD
jgi:Domain of unknown function (DUF222)/HNH endonuclease